MKKACGPYVVTQSSVCPHSMTTSLSFQPHIINVIFPAHKLQTLAFLSLLQAQRDPSGGRMASKE